MDKFAALRTFVQVVDDQGFSAAARSLGISRSATNRMVIDLEQSLGAQLLNRTTRQVSPTATGRAFYERARQILDDVEEAEHSVIAHHDEPVGAMRINAPMSFGTLHLSSAVTDFMVQYKDVQIQLVLDDRFVDPVSEGYDLTIRIAEPDEDTSFVDYRIVEIRRCICAAPEYLERAGVPSQLTELKDRPCLHYGNLASGSYWRFTGPDGQRSIEVNGVLCSNNAEVLRDAATAGLGVAMLPTFIAGRELQAGTLVSILTDYHPPGLVLHAIYPPARHLSAKVRLFTEHLIRRFGDRPYWDLVA